MSIVTFPNIFFACMLFLRLPRIFSPCHIKSHWNLIYREINFLSLSIILFCFASKAEWKEKKKCFRYANHLTPFSSFLACYLSFLPSHIYESFFVDVMLSHSKAIFVRRKKVVDKNFKFCSRVVARYVFA